MSGANEKWKELSEQVIAERDQNRLTELVAMLTDELEVQGFGNKAPFAQPNLSRNQDRSVP
jgi:hypothetical protein